MIYEQLRARTPQLERLEQERSFRLVDEKTPEIAYAEIIIKSPDFRVKIIGERGWAHSEVSPLTSERWLPTGEILVYLGKDLDKNHPYGRVPLSVELDQIDMEYSTFSAILNDPNRIQEIQALVAQRLDAYLKRMRD
jgi:hypothetical protein